MHKVLRSLLSAVAAGTAALVAAPAVADETAPVAAGYFVPVSYILVPASGTKAAMMAFKPCSQVHLGRLSTDPALPSVAFCSMADVKPGKPGRAAAKPAARKPVVTTPVGYVVPSYIVQMPTLAMPFN